MGKLTRRTDLLASVALAGAASVLLAACSSGSQPGAPASTGDDGTAQDLGSVRVAYTSSVDPAEVAMYAAAPDFGAEFGLQQNVSDLQVFDSHGTAAQVVLSGGSDVVAGSFLSDLQIIEGGEDLRVFCPALSGFDSRIVGVGDVTELEQVADPSTRLAIEGPGGPVNFMTDLVLRARGVDINTTEMTNVSIIEDSPLRVAALANGDADVALINAFQVPQLEEQIGAENVHILSNVMEDVGGGGIILAFAATKDYLDQNLDQATAFCASVLKANRELTADFDLYKKAADKYIQPTVEEDLLRQTWDSVGDANLWPFNNGLTEEGVQQVVEIAQDTGLLHTELGYDDVVDSRPIDGALELLGGEA